MPVYIVTSEIFVVQLDNDGASLNNGGSIISL
jgi:hypothetical protein